MLDKITRMVKANNEEGIIIGVVPNAYPKEFRAITGHGEEILREDEFEEVGVVNTTTLCLPELSISSSVSIERAMLKLYEEGGELAQAIYKKDSVNGKHHFKSEGEALSSIAEEATDLAQTLVTVLCVLKRDFGVDITEEGMKNHYAKLIRKGYL